MLARSLLVAVLCWVFPICANADTCSNLTTMYGNMVAATSYRLVETSPGAPVATTEYMAPDRIHHLGAGGESITIGTKHYSNVLGKWYETDGPYEPPEVKQFKVYATSDVFKAHCIKNDPSESEGSDGSRTIHMHDAQYDVDTTYYVRPDLLPSRIEITTRGKTYLKTYSDWNATIAIDPPQ